MIVLGKINGFYGVRGWVKLFSHTQPREQILTYNPIYIRPAARDSRANAHGSDDNWEPIKILQRRKQGSNVLALLENIDSKEKAAEYLGFEIGIKREQLPKLKKDAYYWNDLEGLTVVDSDNNAFGKIDHMIETGANDVMVITTAGTAAEKHGQTILIPFTIDYHVLSVDLTNEVVVVDWDPDF
jgi:16S rRNA processing protein RimM